VGPANDSGVVDDDNVGGLSGYFFRNARDKTSNITCSYATHCRSVIDCKIKDLESVP